MNRRASAPIIILVALIVLSLAVAGGVFYLLQQERTKAQGLELKLEDLSTKQKITETRLKESEKLIMDLKSKLQDAGKQIEAMKMDLERERQDKQEVAGKVNLLQSDLEQQKSLRADLEDKLARAQVSVNSAQEQIKKIEQQKIELELKIKNLELKSQSVELGKIVVTEPVKVSAAAKQAAPAPQAKQAKLEGSVLVVNKEYNFAVINLGARDGLKADDVFLVSHDNKQIGELKVEKVHDTMSAAGFVNADMKDKISEGDKVTQKNK